MDNSDKLLDCSNGSKIILVLAYTILARLRDLPNRPYTSALLFVRSSNQAIQLPQLRLIDKYDTRH
jgi:hypothetical protein